MGIVVELTPQLVASFQGQASEELGQQGFSTDRLRYGVFVGSDECQCQQMVGTVVSEMLEGQEQLPTQKVVTEVTKQEDQAESSKVAASIWQRLDVPETGGIVLRKLLK